MIALEGTPRFRAELELTNASFPRDFELALGSSEQIERRFSFQKKEDTYYIRFEFETNLIPDPQRANEIFGPLADIIVYFAKTKLDYRFMLTDVKSGNQYLIRPELRRDYVLRTELTDEIMEKVRSIFFKLYSKYSIRDDEVEEHYLFVNALRWYRKSLEGDRVDRFVFLWIVFNMLYNYAWFRKHSETDKQRETDRIKYLVESGDENSGLITYDDCKTLIAENYWLARSMHSYDMVAPKKASPNPSKEELERLHAQFIEEHGDLDQYLLNKYGTEFAKFVILNDWKNAMRQALLAIYGDRCSIFHEGHFPVNTQEWDDPHDARVFLLDNVVHVALDKLLL